MTFDAEVPSPKLDSSGSAAANDRNRRRERVVITIVETDSQPQSGLYYHMWNENSKFPTFQPRQLRTGQLLRFAAILLSVCATL